MTWIADQLAHAEKIKAARAAQYATETLVEALTALEIAQARYDAMPGSRRAYDKAAVKDRVAAARERDWEQRERAWRNSTAYQVWLDLPPSPKVLAELRTYRMV